MSKQFQRLTMAFRPGSTLVSLSFFSAMALSLPTATLAQVEQSGQNQTPDFPDVDSGTWAAESIYNLNERYGCIEGFPDGTFQGETALTRYQFAAGLYACLNNYDSEIQDRIVQLVTQEDLAILFRVLSTLFEDTSPELEGGNPLLPEDNFTVPDMEQQPPAPLGEPLAPPDLDEDMPDLQDNSPDIPRTPVTPRDR